MLSTVFVGTLFFLFDVLLVPQETAEFWTDDVVFIATTLTIATPLVIEAISRIGERYGSDIAAENLKKKASLRIALPIMFANIIVVIFFKL